MYKLLIDITKGVESREVHALRYSECRVLMLDEVFYVEYFHEGEWRYGFRSKRPLHWRLIDEGSGTILADADWYPVDENDQLRPWYEVLAGLAEKNEGESE